MGLFIKTSIRKLFGTSGIRGVYGEKITPEFCCDLGLAIGTTLPIGSTVCMATDTRLTRDIVALSTAAGLGQAGVNVVFLGVLPTSVVSFLAKDYEAGIMLTASHNPPEYNGIKVYDKTGKGFAQAHEEKIEKVYADKSFRRADWKDAGTFTFDKQARERFIQAAIAKPINCSLKVLVDAGNGAASGLVTEILKRTGVDVIAINDEPDGMFPGRSAEPRAETLQGTIKAVQENNCDIALCLDGDADRIMFCDKQGFLGYNEMIGYISREMVKATGKKTVYTTVETGFLLDEAIKDVGGIVKRGIVGDVRISEAMQADPDACIGVEQCGHYINPMISLGPDVVFVSLFLLDKLKRAGDIREFFSKLPPLYYDKIGVDVPDEIKYEIESKIPNHIGVFNAPRVIDTDGVRLEFDDAWVLLRASGTQPMIRVNVEAKTQERLKELLEKGEQVVRKCIEDVKK